MSGKGRPVDLPRRRRRWEIYFILLKEDKEWCFGEPFVRGGRLARASEWGMEGRLSPWLRCPPRSILNVFSGEEEEVGRVPRVTVREGRGEEALRAQEAGLIPISWRGANVHAIYCMTDSHISINPLHKMGKLKRVLRARSVCAVACKKGRWKGGRKGWRKGVTENKDLGERCNIKEINKRC